MFGYVAEMLLKTAYCEVVGLAPNAPMYPALATVSAATHNLPILQSVLERARLGVGNPMSAPFVTTLTVCVAAIHSQCEVVSRYYDFAATASEVEDVYASVDWLLNNYNRLIR